MTDRLHLEPRHRETLETLLQERLPDTEVWAYGSRVSGKSHDGSDLDLVLRGPGLREIPLCRLEDFEEAVRQSNLPFLVEARDWARLPERFHRNIERDYVVLRDISEGCADGGSDDWRDMPFSEAVEVNPSVRLERGTMYPFVDMAAVDAGSRSVDAVEQRAYSGGGSRFQSGDTLMARITPCLENGKVARYRATRQPLAAHGSTEFIVIRGRACVTDSEFAYYLTQWEAVRSYAIDQMTGTSGRQRVPTDSLNHLAVPVPPLPEQRAIARILGALDDRIELNRRMNETLEATARALFKSWFVDFDPVRAKIEGRDTGLPRRIADLFPDRLIASELGEIPEGWKTGCLDDIANSPRKGIDPGELAQGTPYIGLEHMPRESIALSEWQGSEKVSSNKSVFEKGQFLFGKLRPYFHKVGIAPINGICSTDIVIVTPIKDIWSAYVLMTISSRDFVKYTDRTSSGTKMPRTSWKTMSRYPLSLPPDNVLRKFEDATHPMLDRIVANILCSRTIRALRDALLPKLVSGEISTRAMDEPRADKARRAVGGAP